MSFDIYGEHLAIGHCEVHPWVHCEYPCPCCMDDYDRRKLEKDDYDRCMRQLEDQYYAQLAGDAEYESWAFSPRGAEDNRG